MAKKAFDQWHDRAKDRRKEIIATFVRGLVNNWNEDESNKEQIIRMPSWLMDKEVVRQVFVDLGYECKMAYGYEQIPDEPPGTVYDEVLFKVKRK